MFQNLRKGTPLYVLHKNEPRFEVAEVVSVSTPQPEFGNAFSAGIPYQKQTMLVDVQVKIGDDTIDLQKLPAESVIADFGNAGMVISESREAMLNEVELLRKNSEKVLESMDYHTKVVEQCTTITTELNPIAKQDAEQKKEMDAFRQELSEVKETMGNIEALLTKMAKSKSKED